MGTHTKRTLSAFVRPLVPDVEWSKLSRKVMSTKSSLSDGVTKPCISPAKTILNLGKLRKTSLGFLRHIMGYYVILCWKLSSGALAITSQSHIVEVLNTKKGRIRFAIVICIYLLNTGKFHYTPWLHQFVLI